MDEFVTLRERSKYLRDEVILKLSLQIIGSHLKRNSRKVSGSVKLEIETSEKFGTSAIKWKVLAKRESIRNINSVAGSPFQVDNLKRHASKS